MDGIILIDKDKDMTSRDVVNFLVKKFKTKKIGHFGTLDPLATGLLVVGIGAYTKAQSLFDDESKSYDVEVLIGRSTDTYDITGNTISLCDSFVTSDEIVSHLNSFIGGYNQEVPKYSAVKINGKKLYEYARENVPVVLPSREVTIFDIKFGNLFERDGFFYFTFSCHVSKGTYIRSLINDLSVRMGVPMCMSALRRIKCGAFSIDESYSLSDIESDNYSIYDATSFLDVCVLDIPDNIYTKVINGSIIDKISDKYILFRNGSSYVSLYGPYGDMMKPYLMFNK